MKPFFQNKKRTDLILFGIILAILLWLTFDFNYEDQKNTGPGVFHADKIHYYIYLPATFIYGWDINKFPYRIDTVYHGTQFDYNKQKIIIKTTCGVALLGTPFFLITHGIALLSGISADGFSDYYEKMALVTPVFYLVLGLFFLKNFLDKYFRSYVSWLTIMIVFAGTNLYYYTVSEGWMSHIFSFFLFSSTLYFLKGFLDSDKKNYLKFIFTAFSVSMAVLIRPTSIILLFWIILLDVRSFREVLERILFFLHPKYSLPFVLTGIIVFIPQAFYWHYLSGSWFFYSYPGETFMFWKDPSLIQVWFAPLNGLFLYNPLVLLMVIGMVFMIWKRIPNGWFMAFVFLLNSYVIASWHIWFFGGSFGCRPFSEYFALLSLPFAWVLSTVFRIRNLFMKSMLILVILIFVFLNQRMIYNPRWNTSSTWAWDNLRNYLDSKGIIHFHKRSFTHIKDYENYGHWSPESPTRIRFHSRTQAGLLNPIWEFGGRYTHGLGRFLDNPVEKIEVSCWVSPFGSDDCGAEMISTIVHNKAGLMMYQAVPLNKQGTKKGQWSKVETEIPVPLWMNDPEYQYHFYIWNKQKRFLILDDVRVSFR